jgi:gamma-glutamylaminecyclotransferase
MAWSREASVASSAAPPPEVAGDDGAARVFVFGNLKRGFPLHEQGLRGARYLGACRTVERFPMFVAGPGYAPMMLNQPGAGLRVRGELYLIGAPSLSLLDTLESVGRPGNDRLVIAVAPVAGGATRAAHAFLKSAERAFPIHSARLDDYQDRRFVPAARRKGREEVA